MLREYEPTRQVPGERRRRWFASPKCDLIVWIGDDDSPVGFQFCYDKDYREHALTWLPDRGFSHLGVDSGSDVRPYKGTPLLVANGISDAGRILELFHAESELLPKQIIELVSNKLRELAAST